MNIIQQFITKDDSYRNNVNKVDSRYTTFQKRGPIGLMLHSVGCSQPSAKVFADGWNRSGREASVHAVLQADGTVYQTMPWNFRAWHCGGAANDTHVGVEMTEPGCITYISGSRFTCSDLAAAKAQVKGTYNTAADLFAMLCDKYDLDPLTAIISHKEGNDKGVASNHGDPEHLWKGLDMGYTMDGFRKEVKRRLDLMHQPVTPDTPIKDDEEDDDMNAAEVIKLIKENRQAPTRDEIMKATGDKWIEEFTDLPPWAEDEVRELIVMGAIKGTKLGDTVEETKLDASLNTYIRPCIVALRIAKQLYENAPAEALAAEMERVAAFLRGGTE